jgi:hypothetical protein
LGLRGKPDIEAAFLSLLLPGLGQLGQGRRLGWFHLVWAVAACVLIVAGPAIHLPRPLAAFDLIVVTAWSVLDALVNPRRPGASSVI